MWLQRQPAAMSSDDGAGLAGSVRGFSRAVRRGQDVAKAIRSSGVYRGRATSRRARRAHDARSAISTSLAILPLVSSLPTAAR